MPLGVSFSMLIHPPFGDHVGHQVGLGDTGHQVLWEEYVLGQFIHAYIQLIPASEPSFHSSHPSMPIGAAQRDPDSRKGYLITGSVI